MRYIIAKDLYAEHSFYVIDSEEDTILAWCGTLEQAYRVIAQRVVVCAPAANR